MHIMFYPQILVSLPTVSPLQTLKQQNQKSLELFYSNPVIL